MRDWIRRIHIWLGLLSCTALLTFGAAGFSTAWRQRPWRPEPPRIVREVPFEVDRSAGDLAAATAAHEKLALPLSRPVGAGELRRDDTGNLRFTLYTLNGDHRVTLVEEASVLRVETTPVALDDFLNRMHSTLLKAQSADTDWRVRSWAYYIEFSIWAVLLMPLTGLYLFVATRARHRLAWAMTVGGVASAILFYAIVR